VVVAGSFAICLHLGAVGINVLAAPSGPWPGPEGPAQDPPPPFAQDLNQLAPTYLSALKINPTYHFESNRPGVQGVYFIARVKDEAGHVIKTVRVPDPSANVWVRYREGRLAQGLGQDVVVPPGQAEKLPAPKQQVKMVRFWLRTGEHDYVLKESPEHLVPRGQPVFQPSPLSMLLARAYARYLCRTYGGASVEIDRHHREVIGPHLLFPPPGGPPDALPREAFEEITNSFGELRP
jgi:hypothetical protein